MNTNINESSNTISCIKHAVIHGDCLDEMKKIPDKSIDFICSDFPYNISNKGGLTARGKKVVRADFGEWDKWDSMTDYIQFVMQVCKEYQRILKPNASMVLFFSYRYSGWIAYELERMGWFTYRNPIIFHKTNPQRHYKENGFRSCLEVGVWLVNDGGHFNKPKTFNFLGQDKMKNVLNYKIGNEGDKQSKHPTEKPECLISDLIEVFTNPGEIVLDSFAGGGTTGVAAYKIGRHCISIEQSGEFIQMIKERQARAARKGK